MDISTEQTPGEMLAELDRLMKAGDWFRAHNTTQMLILEPKYTAFARTWFMSATTHYAYGAHVRAKDAFEKARKCKDYTEVAEYEFLCEWAMAWCRSSLRHHKDVELARGYLDRADWLCGDDNFLWYLASIDARILLRTAMECSDRVDAFEKSRLSAKAADDGWRVLGEAADQEKMATNRLYLLIATMMSGDHAAARELVIRIINKDEDSDRRIATFRIGTALSTDDVARRVTCEEVLLMF